MGRQEPGNFKTTRTLLQMLELGYQYGELILQGAPAPLLGERRRNPKSNGCTFSVGEGRE